MTAPTHEFRWLWLADVQSALGDQLARVALVVLVFHRTDSAWWTSLVFAMSFLPAMVGGLFLAQLGDMFSRRNLMVFCDVLRAALVAAMAWRSMPLLGLCVLVACEALAASVFVSAETALLPQVLHGADLARGMGVRTASIQTAQLAGFAAGGILVAAVGASTGLLLDAASFVVSAALVAMCIRNRPRSREVSEGTGLRSALDGARVIAGSPQLRLLAGLIWMVAVYSVTDGIAAPYARSVGAGSVGTGMLLAAIPAGTALGVYLVTHVLPETRRLAWTPLLAALTGVPLLACALHPGLVVTILLWALSGILSAYYVLAAAEFTGTVPDQVRAQVMGFTSSVLITAQGVAVTCGGAVAVALGVTGTLAACGAVGLVLGIALHARWRRVHAVS